MKDSVALEIAVEKISRLWPVFAFIIGIIWKQIITHFDVKSLMDTQGKLESRTEELENEFNTALKDHVIENKVSNEKLTEAITELIKTTTILAVKIEAFEKSKEP